LAPKTQDASGGGREHLHERRPGRTRIEGDVLDPWRAAVAFGVLRLARDIPDPYRTVLTAARQIRFVGAPRKRKRAAFVSGEARHDLTRLKFENDDGSARQGGGQQRAVPRASDGNRKVVEIMRPSRRKGWRRRRYARHARKSAVSCSRSRLRPMKTSMLRRGSFPHSRSGRPSKSMCTP